jgi:protein gp37
MSGPTKIEWADSVWNPVTGCTKVSEGCRNCYAERMATRLAGRAGYPVEHPFAVTLHPDRLNEPLRWRKPRRIFVCSMSDLFHPDVPDDFILTVWNRMACSAWHTYQVLTKRPERAVELLGPFFPLPHVWLGVSVEDQPTADERIPHLLRCPAAVRFVSYEPPLGPVDFLRPEAWWLGRPTQAHGMHQGLDWAIAGGESGPKARPAHPDWFRSVRDQCQAAGVPFFFKGWAQWCPEDHLTAEGVGKKPRYSYPWNRHEWDYRTGLNPSWRVGKKAAGRLLDGVEHNAYPGEATS